MWRGKNRIKAGAPSRIVLAAAAAFMLLLLPGCVSSHYSREFLQVEDSYYNGDYDAAVAQTRELASITGSKELMLYSMEAGVIFHTMGDIESSDRAFRQADALAQQLSRSTMEEISSFILNETEKKFIGQNFERVLIKYYLALNRLAEGDLENAKVYFRDLNYELHDMKYFDELYKQNAAARYLDAVVSEQLGDYNDARVQLKNLAALFPSLLEEIREAQYVLAVKEGVKEDQERFSQGAETIAAFNTEGEPIPYRSDLAEIVLINYAGQAAVKASRGRIAEEPLLLAAFKESLYQQNSRAMQRSLQQVMRILDTAENPIPEYMRRDPAGSRRVAVELQGRRAGTTKPFFSYSQTAMRHFNDHYEEMIQKNIGSLTAKIITALAAGQTAEMAAAGLNAAAAAQGNTQQVNTDDAHLAGTMIALSQLYQTIAPDLRCWRLLPDNYQILRLYVEPGSYSLALQPPDGTRTTWEGGEVRVGPGDIRFISFQTMSSDRHRYRLVP